MTASTTVTTGALDKAQFVDRANVICDVSRARILRWFTALKKREGSDLSRRRLLAGASKSFILPGIEFQFDDLLAMGGPDGEEGEVEEMLGAMQLAIETGQRQRVFAAARLSKLFEDFNRLARRYGIGHCAVDERTYGSLWRRG